MAPLIELDPQIKKEMKEVWSFPGDPPGEYIGSENKNGRMYHYYKKGSDYFFENDFDREMRKKEKERKRYKWTGRNRKIDISGR